MVNSKRKTTYFCLYIFSALLILAEVVWSFFSISPFERIGITLFASVALYIGAAAEISFKGKSIEKKVMHRTFYILFAYFLLLFLALVFLDSYFGDSRADISKIGKEMNLIPFKTSASLIYGTSKGWVAPEKPLINIVGNLVICMPFALFLPLLFKRQRKFLSFLTLIFAVVLIVELIQFASARGVFDIDDLILNVGGAAIAFGILHIKPLRKIVQKITKLEY